LPRNSELSPALIVAASFIDHPDDVPFVMGTAARCHGCAQAVVVAELPPLDLLKLLIRRGV